MWARFGGARQRLAYPAERDTIQPTSFRLTRFASACLPAEMGKRDVAHDGVRTQLDDF